MEFVAVSFTKGFIVFLCSVAVLTSVEMQEKTSFQTNFINRVVVSDKLAIACLTHYKKMSVFRQHKAVNFTPLKTRPVGSPDKRLWSGSRAQTV